MSEPSIDKIYDTLFRSLGATQIISASITENDLRQLLITAYWRRAKLNEAISIAEKYFGVNNDTDSAEDKRTS
jgi:hypothetical protein